MEKILQSKKGNFFKMNVTIAFIVSILFFGGSNEVFGQAVTTTWALTSNGNGSATGAGASTVTATALAAGTGIGTPSYGSPDGVTASGWANDGGSLNSNEYYEYKVTATAGNKLTVSSVTLNHSVTAGTWIAAVYYSYDGFATTGVQIGSNFTATTTQTALNLTSLSLSVPIGGSFSIRVYAWESDGNNRRFRNRDVVITGTTCQTVTYSPQPLPQNLCAGATLSLTPTINNASSYQWYKNGTAISGATAASYSKTNIVAGDAGDYYVIATGSCGGAIASNSAAVTVSPLPTAVSASSNLSTICSGGSINLSSSATSNSSTRPLISQNFNGALNGWTTINNSTGATPANAAWTLRANGYNNGDGAINSNDTSQFYMSDSDAQGDGGTTATLLQSPAFSTVGLSAASLTFYHYYRYFSTSIAAVEVSTNGTSWTVLPSATYNTADQGTRTGFVLVTLSLASYLNQATVYIRFKYDGQWVYYWAIDNVAVTGTLTAPAASYAWTSSPGTYTSSTQNPTGVAPLVNTVYNVSVTNAYGCSAGASTASVTVNALPIANNIAPNVAAGNVCAGQSLSATFSGASGGAGTITDVQEFSINNGVNYNPYTAAINTTSLAGQTVIIRTSRTATGSGCTTSPFKTVTWNVIALPVANNIAPNVAAGNVCAGQSLSATFSGASGGIGTITDVQEFSINNGVNYNPYTAAINTTSLAGQTVIIRTSRTATGSGCTTSPFKTVTWNVIALPVANNIAPNVPAGNVCAGQSLSATFSGASGGAGTVTDVQEFSINNGVNYNPYTAAINTTSLAGQTVIIRTSRTATGSGCTTSPFKTVTWTIDSLSVAPTGVTGTTSICSGTGTSLTVAGGSKGTGAQTKWYTGSCGGALVHTGDTLNTGNLMADATYYVSYLGTCNETTCATVIVTVNALPTTSAISGLNSVCATSIGVGYNVTNTVGSSYTWTITGGTQTSGGTTNSITVDWGAAGAGNVSVMETNAAGCVGSAVNHPVTINALPTTSAISGLNSVCATSTGVAYNVTNTAGSSYAWTITGGTQTSGGTTNSITVDWSAAGAGNVSVLETNSIGCVGSAVNHAVTINALPTTSAISGLNSVCATSTGVAYNVTNTVGSSYAWTITGGTQTSGGTTNSITVDWSAAGAGNVSVLETNSIGCVGSAVNHAVTVNALPTTSAISGLNSVCATSTGIAYNVTNTAGSSYTWTITGGTQASGTTTNSITVNWGAAGSGNVSVLETSAPGCVASAVDQAVTIVTNLTWYRDADADTYGNPLVSQSNCEDPSTPGVLWVLDNTDCNDASATVHPNATEICFNNIDDDCDGDKLDGVCQPVVANLTNAYPNNMVLGGLSTTIISTIPVVSGFPITGYIFEITNESTNVTVELPTVVNKFNLTQTNIFAYDTYYNIRVRAIVNGEEQDYQGSVRRLKTPALASPILLPTQCNVNIPSIGTVIFSQSVLSATDYEFTLTSGAFTMPATQVITRQVNKFSLSMMQNYVPAYSTDYYVTVRVKVGGAWSTGITAPCRITTPGVPNTQLVASQCSGNLPSISSTLTANTIQYATQYTFKVAKAATPGIFVEKTVNSNPLLQLNTLTGLAIEYDTTYSVWVKAVTATTSGTYTEFPCDVTTPATPSSSLVAGVGFTGNCEDGFEVASNATVITSATYPSAKYHYIIKGYNGNVLIYNQFVDRSTNNNVSLSMFPTIPYAPGYTYYMSVALKLASGLVQPKEECEIFLPELGREIVVEDTSNLKVNFSATAYPNPFANNFMIDVKTRNESAVSLKVYDMLGRLVEQRSVSVSNLETTPIGDNYPSGVYNVIVTQGEDVKTVRVVKR